MELRLVVVKMEVGEDELDLPCKYSVGGGAV